MRNTLLRRLWRWLRRGLLVLVGVIVALGLVGAVYQVLAEARDMRAYPPPGQLIDIGGYKLHIHCLGNPASTPTIVLEAGLGGTSVDWVYVHHNLAASVRVCAYDRAGYGWSELGPNPRDAEHVAAELHTLLQRANIRPPYVLVGHSFGGIYLRVYTAHYPDEVIGVALIDSSHPEQMTRSAEGQAMYQSNLRLAQIFPIAARLGLPRGSDFFKADPALPLETQAQSRALVYRTQTADANYAEFSVSAEAFAQAAASPDFGNRPLAVLTAGDNVRENAIWGVFQAELARLSTNSIHQTLDGATHASVIHDEANAQVTSALIQRVVEAAATGQPLATN